MNRAFLSVSSAVLLAIAIRAPDQPRFAVEEKTSLAKTFESTFHLASTSFQLTIEGHDEPMPGIGELELTMDSTERIEVTDRYLATDDGRPVRLQRTFDKLEGTDRRRVKGHGGEDQDESVEQESPLEGRSVLFTWNEDGSRFDASFAEGKGDESLLEELSEDMDFRALLPEAKVAEGDRWDVDAKVFDAVLSPGGDLKLAASRSADEEDDDSGKIDKALRKNLAGKGQAVWKGVREEEERKVGVIAITAELTSEGEVESEAEGGKIGFKAAMEVEGELLWDLAAGHFRSFQSTAKTKFSMTTTSEIDFDGRAIEMRQATDLEGEWTLRASAR